MSSGPSDLDRLRLLSDALRVFVPGATPTPELRAESLGDSARVLSLIAEVVGPLEPIISGPVVNVAQPTAEECAAIVAPPKSPGFFSRLSAWLRYDAPPVGVPELPLQRATMLAAVSKPGPRNTTQLAAGVALTPGGTLLLVRDSAIPPIPRLGGRFHPADAVASNAWELLSTRIAVTERSVSRSDGSGYSYDDVVRTKTVVAADVVPLTATNLPDTESELVSAILPALERSVIAQIFATPTTARPQLPSHVLKALLLSPHQETRLAATQWVGEWGQARRVAEASPSATDGTGRGGR